METHASQSFHKQGLAQIAGVGLRLPQANNIDELADMLLNKKCVLGDPRWPPGLYGMDHLLGCVNDIGMMDCDFFNIPPEEAESCNPMLGPLLEVVTECILDSGLKLCDVAKLKTGFFLGVTFCDTDILTILNTDSSSAFTNTRGELCSRVAQQFDLKGPVMQVDGACASSFAAIHTALIDLQTKRCDLAIVAGSNLILDPTVSLQFSKLNMLSPNGQSCPFDEAANGYVRSDGIAAILLKLPDSVATTRIYCDIVGFGLKADGAKVKGIINPSHKVQTSLLTEVYNKYEIDVNDIAYYEAHGTSTQQGDKAELTSIDKVICSSRQEPLLVGSIKGNIGHTEACAGMAGIMKCLASYKTKTIFSNVNYSKPNSSIKALHTGTIVIPTSNIPLPKGGLMSVSSFGFGGLGGHIVLKQCNQKGDQKPVSHPVLVPLSLHPFADPQKAKDELKKRISERAFYNYLLNSELCGGYTNPQRTFIIAEPASESLLFSKCQNLDLRVKQVTAVFSDFFTNPWTPHKNITSIPAVKISLQRSQESCKERHSGWLFEALASDSAPRPLDCDGVTMRVACQIAIVDLMLELGVLRHFHTIRGVGIGTLAAAYADGVLSQSQCMQAADIMESTLIDENFNQKETTLIQVELEQNELYLLGPWVRIIRKYNNGKTLIAVLQNKGEEVMNLLKSNGDNFAVLDYHISVYTPLPRDVRSNLLIKLRQVIPSPLMWSAKAEITGLKQRGNFIRYCDALFLAEMLTRPYEKFTESASSWSFSLKRKDVLHHMDTFQSDLSSDFKRSNSASDIDFFNSAVNESDERNPACGNQGEYANITSETNSDDAFESITLNFFVDSKQLTNSACPMTPTQETNVVDDSVPKGCDFIPVPPYASGFLSAAGHIHVAGHDVQVSSLFGTEKGNQNTMYCGDFPTHLLWAWEHSAHGIDMDWRMKTKCGKNSKQQPVIEFSPEDYPMPEQLGLGLIAPMFRTVTTFLESELEDGKVLTLDNIKVIELTSEDCLPDEIDKIYGRLFTQSHRFCVERVGHVRVHGYYDVIQNNPAREMKGQNFPYSVTVNKPEEMLRNLFILFKHLFDEISPHRLLWDPMKHDHVLTKAMESMKHQRNTLKIPCSVDTNSGIMMCGGFILHSLSSKPRLAGLPKNINTGSLALASANEITRNSNETKICEAQCAFYECLYQLQPTFLDMTEKNANEERRTPKQVRFSTDTRENEHEVINRPLTPGLLQSFHSVFSSIGSQDDLDYTENASGALSASSFEQKSEVSERDASTPIDGKYLAVALSSVQGDNFRFVDCLDMDEMLTDTLLNMLQLFLPGTTLHVYIAQKKLSSQASPYVLYLFTDIPASGLVIPKVKVLLRDRNTDITEACTSLASAFSVVSTFVDNLYTSYEARVYSVMEVEGQENCPASSWETVLLGEETKMLEDVMGNYEHDVLQCHVPNCLSCMANSNELSSPRFDAVDGSSGCSSQSSSPGKRNSCFCLNLDSMFEKALNKLAVINGHVIAIVKPRDGSKSNTTDTGQLFNKDDPLLMSKNPDGDFTELSKGWGCCKRESHDSVVLNSKDNLPFSPPKLDKGTNKRCGTDKNNERQCQYMISLNKEHKNVVYLYSQANRDVIHFNNVRALLAQLKKWHPQIDVTHEVLVSKLNDNSSFDELLYNFWHSEVNMSDIVMNGTCSEEDKTGNGINGNELPILKGQSVSAPAVQPMLQTPISIVIPEIFITPPLEEKSAKFSELKERMNGSDTNYSEKQEDKQAMDVTSKEMDSLLSVPQDENEIQITTKMPPFNMQPFSKTPTTANIQQIFTPPPFEKMSAPSSDLKDKMNGSNPNSSKKLEGKQAKDVSCKNVNSPSLLKVPQDENEIQITTKMPPFNMQSLGQIPISTTSNKDTDSPSLLNVPQDENEIQITTKMPPFNMQSLGQIPISTTSNKDTDSPSLLNVPQDENEIQITTKMPPFNMQSLGQIPISTTSNKDTDSPSLLKVPQDENEIQITTKMPPFNMQSLGQIPISTTSNKDTDSPSLLNVPQDENEIQITTKMPPFNMQSLGQIPISTTSNKDTDSPSLLNVPQDENEIQITTKMPPFNMQSLGQIPISTTSNKDTDSPSLLKVPQDENEIQITTKMPPFNMQSLGQIPISTTSNKDTDSPSLLNVPQDENEIQITTKMPPFNMQPLAHTPISTEVPQVSITPPLEEKSSKSSDLNGKINGSSQNCSKKLENGKVKDSASEDIKSSSLLSVQQDQCEIQINTKIPPFKIQPSVQTPTSTVVPQISITPPFEDKSSQSCDLKDEINGSCLNFSRRLKNEQMINTAGKDNESPSLLELSQDECEAEISAKMPPVYFQDKVGNKIKPPYFACCDGLKGKKRLLGTLGTRKEQNFKPVAGPDEDCSVEIVELVSESSELVSASSVMSASDMEVCKIFSEESSSSVKSSLINSVEEVSDKNFEITSASIEKTSKDSSFCDLLPDAKVDMCLMVHLIDHKSPVGQQTGRTAGNLLMYVADFEEEDDDRVGRPETQCLGFLLFDELTLRHANFTVNSCLRFEHLESCLEIMVAMYILEELSLLHADDTKKKTVLIQAPIYREPAFVMFLARHLKCGTIITSSSIPAVRDRLQNLIPNIIVLSEPIRPCRVLPLTNGKGCDIVVMFNDQATEEYLDLVACSGSLIMCGKIDPFQEIGMSCFLRNISIYSLDVLRVVCHYMTLGLSQRQKFEESLLHHLHALGNLVNLEFPAGNEGCFHSVLGRMKELPPLFQPEVNDVIQMFMSMTVSASQVLASVKEEQRQTLQYIYQVMATVFSSDYSVSSSSLQIQCMGSPQKDIERSIFNIPKEALRKRSSSVFHPEDFDYSWNEPSEVETPVVRVVSCDSSVTSLSEAETSESDSQKREQAKVPVLFRRGFQESAALQDIVNSVDGDTIVKLNSCHKGRPFFIVHPVMGTVTCFHALAEKLQIPVCGIQCTNQGYMKCMDGMEALARFYVQELVKMYPEGPVYLGGYSFGTALAYEMAILLEGSDRIQHLLLLDGSLQYIKAHINYEMQFLSAGKSEHQKFVCALLLSFVRLYLADIPAHEASPLLLGSDTQERQIETAADLSLGYVKLGFKFDLKDRWRLVSDKMKKKRRLDSFRKSITCSRSNSISCDTCRLALSGAVDVMHEDSSDGADESNSSPPLGPSDTEACHICGDSQVPKEKSTQPLTEVRKRESICGHNCPEACQIIPELFMSEPACSLADTSDRVMFSLRKRKAERFLQLGLMVENYVPKPLKSVPCSLIRVNSPPPYINLPDLDPQYGMSGLVDDKNFKLLFIEGDHHSCLQHPHVEKLAEMIERLFHA